VKSENSPSSYNASTPIQIAIVAEGPTEQQFILNHLTPYLHDMSDGRINVQPITVKTGRPANGKICGPAEDHGIPNQGRGMTN